MTREQNDKKRNPASSKSKVLKGEKGTESTSKDPKYRLVVSAAKAAEQTGGSRAAAAGGSKQRDIKSLGIPGSIQVSEIRAAVRAVAMESLDLAQKK